MAWTRIESYRMGRPGLLGFGFGGVRAVFLEGPGRRKFSQPMADHVFGDEHGIKHLAVMHVEGEADEIGRDHRTPRPGLDRSLGLGVLGLNDFFHEMAIDERAFFDRASHNNLSVNHFQWRFYALRPILHPPAPLT